MVFSLERKPSSKKVGFYLFSAVIAILGVIGLFAYLSSFSSSIIWLLGLGVPSIGVGLFACYKAFLYILKLQQQHKVDTAQICALTAEVNTTITEYKVMEEALRESLERFNLAVQGANEGIWDAQFEADQIFAPTSAVWYSPRFKQLLGYTEDEFENTGQSLLNHLHPEDRDITIGALIEHTRNQEFHDLEFRMQARSGEYLWFCSRGKATWDEQAHVVRMAGSIREITERKHTETVLLNSNDELERRVHDRTKELQKVNNYLKQEIAEHRKTERELLEAKDAAESADRAKSEFLATMSHEIRTPMNVILSMTDLLQDMSLPQQPLEYLKYLKKSGNNLLHLINDILDLSKMESNHIEMESTAFNLSQLVRLSMNHFEDKALEQQIDLVSDIALSPEHYVLGDPKRVQQILNHLIDNAIKFTDQGMVAVSVCAVEEHPHSFKFSVKDTGIGISEEKQESIFAAFTQSDSSTTRRHGGMGLGLTITKKLVELHGGKIWVESTEGEGSTFHVIIPLLGHSEQTSLEAPPKIIETSESQIAEASVCRILLCGSLSHLITTIQDALENRAFHIDFANSTNELLAASQKQDYHIIFMAPSPDTSSPYPAAEALREWEADANHYQIPIIAILQESLKEHVQQCLDAGCTDYLVAPISPEQLKQKINIYL